MTPVTFTKLFSSITESTVWCESDQVRIVWITMLAMANKNGFVFGSVPGLANRARVSVDACREALHRFQQPDPDSRTKEFEGRRIEEVDGGWRLLTYAKHRAIRDEEERKEYMKNLMREKRAAEKAVSNVSHGKPPLSQAEAEAEADSREQIAERSKSKALAQLSLSDAESIYNLYPRKVGKSAALKAIKNAIKRVIQGEYQKRTLTEEQALAGLRNRTMMFAQSAAGKKASFTPHPATWFNRSSYLDDPKEWNDERPELSKTQQRNRNNDEALLRGFGLIETVADNGGDDGEGVSGGRGAVVEGTVSGSTTGWAGMGLPRAHSDK